MSQLRVVHPITHLSIGGATENTVTTCRYSNPKKFDSAILSGRQSASEENLLERAQGYGISVFECNSMVRSIHPIADVAAYRELLKWFRREKWDIVHTHSSKAGILGRLAAKKAGVPVVIHTIHGWGHHDHMSGPKRALYVGLERFAARHTHRMIGVSQSCVDKGLADGIGRKEQYTVIHSGIDIKRYRDANVDHNSTRANLKIDADTFVVGTISRLSQQKAPDDFVRLAKAVTRVHQNVKFVFVGGGPDEQEFLRLIEQNDLQNSILYLGYRSDIPAMLRTFDAFTLTSLWEGLPRVFAQAMCAGLPIVATNVDGAPEAVQQGVTGYLLEPRDIQGMAEKLICLINDRSLCESMGAKGLSSVDPAFCDRDMVRRIESTYEQCYQTAMGKLTINYPALEQAA